MSDPAPLPALPPLLPADADAATLVGRVDRPGRGPCVVAVRGGEVFDITSRAAPTMRDLCAMPDPAWHAQHADGERLGTVDELAANSWEGRGEPAPPQRQDRNPTTWETAQLWPLNRPPGG